MRKYGKDISANNEITCISGLPRSGKSTLLKREIIPNLLKQGKRVLVVDVNKEYLPAKNLFIFRIEDYSEAETETETLIEYLLDHRGAIDALLIDESNVIFNKMVLSPNARRLVNTLRHEKIDLYAVARRPVDINISISELATHRYIFHVSGVNDIKRLNEIVAGLGDKCAQIKGHEYYEVLNDSELVFHENNQKI